MRHLLGERYWTDADEDEKTILLFCECGESGCGRLVATVTASERAVVWSGLEHRPRSKSAEHETTFVFSRKEYEEALRDPRLP